jgi:hypothetical protein
MSMMGVEVVYLGRFLSLQVYNFEGLMICFLLG